MTEILAFLAEHMVTALIVIAIVGILVLAYLGFLLWRSRRGAGAGASGAAKATEAPAPVVAFTQAADLELSFRRAIRTLKASVTGGAFLYRVPWYLALGPAGTGKSTLLRTVPLPRRVQPDESEASEFSTCQWHFFDGGVVLDVEGSLTLKADLTHDDVAWRRLLALLGRHRSARPIDGVILTLSAPDLLAWRNRPVDELREIGGGIFRRLREAQSELGVRFPVYVVLTQADRLPGFGSFVRAVPRRFHQDMFGWSSPFSLEAGFRPEWVDGGLAEIGDWLRDRATEVMASRNLLADADAVFRFPDVAEALAPAARVILGEVFDESAYHEGFFFRGIYLTGRSADGEEAAPTEGATSGGSDDDRDGDEPVALFVSRLFQKKIFAERGLARGFSTGILDRNRTIRWIQIAAAVLVLVGLPGMWLGQARLRAEVQPIEELLGSVRTNLERMAPGSSSAELSQIGAETVVLSLLREMATLDIRPFWSVFLPSSWFSGLDEEITENLAEGFQEVILPTMRRGIVEWADTLSDPTWALTLGGRVPLDEDIQLAAVSSRFQEYEVLVGYISEISQFAVNADRFNQLSQPGTGGDLQIFADLFGWYYEEDLPEEFVRNDVFYERALRTASERLVARSDWPGFEETSAVVAVGLADRFYTRLGEAVRGLEQTLVATQDPAFTASDLRHLWQDVTHVHRLMISADSAWFDSEAGMVPVLQLMLDSLPRNSDLFSREDFVSRFEDGFRGVRTRQLAVLSRDIDLLARALPPVPDSLPRPVASSALPGTRIDVGPQLRSLSNALDDLLARDFMVPTGDESGPTRPMLAGRPTWNLLPLDDALSHFSEFQAFRDGALQEVPPGLRGLVLSVAGRALEERIRFSLGRALTYEVGVGPEGRAGMEEELRSRLSSFDQAARRLVGMLEMDEQLGGTPAGGAVAEAIILEGSDLLNQVDVLLSEYRLYDPVNGSLAVWRGNAPASLAGFGVADADALEAYLAQQRATLRTLSGYAAPVLAYMALPPVAALLRSEGAELVPSTPALMGRWRGIVRTLDDFENKVPGNALTELEQFVRGDMGLASLGGCAALPPPPSPAAAGGYFEGVRARLARLLTDQCRQLARLALRDGYARLSRFHASQLSGRFPFVELEDQPGAPDADPGAVGTFLQMYEETVAPLGGDAAVLVENLLGNELPADFFRRMEEIRAFLAPVLRPDAEGASGALQVTTTLRTNTSAERGGDQIVDWQVDIGGTSVTYRRAAEAPARWRLGDPVSARLSWASGSPRRPVADPARTDLTVDDATATWTYRGPWALLRMVAAHRPEAGDLTGAVPEDRATVNLRVVTRSSDAVSEPADPAGTQASVFFRLTFLGPSGGPPLLYPRFPVQVPSPGGR